MSSNIILADNGVSSGTAGIKESGGSDGTLQLQTTTSGGTATTAITIDNLQNVGVGVTPSAWTLFKAQEIGSVGNAIFATTSGANADMGIGAGFYYASGNWKYSNTGGYPVGMIFNYSANGQVAWVNATSGTAGNNISFTQAMTIDNSGNFLVSTTNTTKTNTGFRVESGVPNTSRGNSGSFFEFYDTSSGSRIGYISNNGGSATAYNTSGSDYRLKENIVNFSGGLNKINSLRPVSFTWINSKENDYGFIAHELQTIIPQAVTGAKDAVDANGNPEYQSIFPAPAQMIASLVSAIQELSAEVTALKAKVGA